MQVIKIEGEEGKIIFAPTYMSQRKIEHIERQLRKLISAPKEYMTAVEMRDILKEKDPLIGTPGGTLHAYRRRQEMTQQDLARKTGIQQGHISEMERNLRPVGVNVAKKLAKALNCNYRRLL